MSDYKIITENRLDEWVRGNSRIAQGVIVELVFTVTRKIMPFLFNNDLIFFKIFSGFSK